MRIARLRSQVLVSSTGVCSTEDGGHAGKDWESTWRSHTKFSVFFPHRYSSTEISTINLSETLIILRYLSRLSLPVAAFIRTLL